MRRLPRVRLHRLGRAHPPQLSLRRGTGRHHAGFADVQPDGDSVFAGASTLVCWPSPRVRDPGYHDGNDSKVTALARLNSAIPDHSSKGVDVEFGVDVTEGGAVGGGPRGLDADVADGVARIGDGGGASSGVIRLTSIFP